MTLPPPSSASPTASPTRVAVISGTVMVVVALIAYTALELRGADSTTLLSWVGPIIAGVLIVRQQAATSFDAAGQMATMTRQVTQLTMALEAVQAEQSALRTGLDVIAAQTNGALDDRIRGILHDVLVQAPGRHEPPGTG